MKPTIKPPLLRGLDFIFTNKNARQYCRALLSDLLSYCLRNKVVVTAGAGNIVLSVVADNNLL